MERNGKMEDSVEHDYLRCPRCGAELAAGDIYCRQCGRQVGPGAKWYYEPLWIWMLGLFVLGPLAIPMAWLSPKMSGANKIAFTLVAGFLTALFIVLCYVIVSYVLNSFSGINETGALLGY